MDDLRQAARHIAYVVFALWTLSAVVGLVRGLQPAVWGDIQTVALVVAGALFTGQLLSRGGDR